MFISVFLILLSNQPIIHLVFLFLSFYTLTRQSFFILCCIIIISVLMSIFSLVVVKDEAKVVKIHDSYTLVQQGFNKIQVWSTYEGRLGDRVKMSGNLQAAVLDTYGAVMRISYVLENGSLLTLKTSQSLKSKLYEKFNSAPLSRAILFNETIEGLPMMSSLSLQVSGLLLFLNRFLSKYLTEKKIIYYEIGLLVIYGGVFGFTYSLIRILLRKCLSSDVSGIVLLVLFPGSALSFHFLFPYFTSILKSFSNRFSNLPFKLIIPILALQSQRRFNIVEFLLYPVFRIVSGGIVLSLLLIPSTYHFIEIILGWFIVAINWQVFQRFELVGNLSSIGLIILMICFYLDKRVLSGVVYITLVLLMIYPLRTQVVYIDVNQGDATLIQSVFNAHTILIDTGSKRAYKTLKRQLHHYGVKRIDQLIITHEDEDHNGSLEFIMRDFKVGEVIYEYEDIKGLSAFPLYEDYGDINANSLIMGLQIKDKQFLFTGDAGVDQEKQLLRLYPHLKVDILKLGHHGSKTSTSLELVQNIEATLAIASANTKVYGHPHKEVRKTLHQQRVKLLNTDIEGDIRVVFTILFDYVHTQARGFAII